MSGGVEVEDELPDEEEKEVATRLDTRRRHRPHHSSPTHIHRQPNHPHGTLDAALSSPVDAVSGVAPVAGVGVESVDSSGVVFRLRVIEVDHYMSPPLEHADVMTSLFSSKPIVSLPILRVWGRTPAGQGACAHVHGVFPYLYVDLSEAAWDAAADIEARETADRRTRPGAYDLGGSSPSSSLSLHAFLSRFGACVERAMRELQALDRSNRRAAEQPSSEARQDAAENRATDASSSRSRAQQLGGARGGGQLQQYHRRPFIHSMCVVRARSIYGYTPTEKPYIKLSFYEPSALRRVGSLLQSGCILGVAFEVYESHIPFHLQFMVDANIAGMDFVDLGHGVNFRQPMPPPITVLSNGTDDDEQRTKARVTECNSDNVAHGRGGGAVGAARLSVAYESTTREAALGGAPLEPHVHSGASRLWTSESTPAHLLASLRRTKQTRCALEVDCGVESILNVARVRQTPLSRTSAEEKLVQTLAGLWSDERARRVAVKRAARRRAAREAGGGGGGGPLSQESGRSTTSLSQITPLTSQPSQARPTQPPTNLDRAHAAHIERVVARERRYRKRKREEAGEEATPPNETTPRPTSASGQERQIDTPASHHTPRAAHATPPASSGASLDDLEVLLREAEEAGAGEPVEEEAKEDPDSSPSMLASAIRDAHAALRQARTIGRPSASQTPNATPLPLRHGHAAAAHSVPVQLDDLPSAFSMSQLPMPLASTPMPSSQHQTLSPAPQLNTSFFFSQMPSQQQHPPNMTTPLSSQLHSPPLRHSPGVGSSSPFPASSSQRHSSQLLDLAASAFVSQRAEDAFEEEEEAAEEDEDLAPSQRSHRSQRSCATTTAWIDTEKLMMSQAQFARDDATPVDGMSGPHDELEDHREPELAEKPSSDDEAEDKEDAAVREQEEVMHHSGEVETGEELEAMMHSFESNDDQDADAPAATDTSELETHPHARRELNTATGLPFVSMPAPAVPGPPRPLTRIPQMDGADDDPMDDVVDVTRDRQHHHRRQRTTTSTTTATSHTPGTPSPSSRARSSLHFERILESRTVRVVGASSTATTPTEEVHYKMQLCYGDGSLVPASSGGVKWFKERRLRARPDLLRNFRRNNAATAAAKTATTNNNNNSHTRGETTNTTTAAARATATDLTSPDRATNARASGAANEPSLSRSSRDPPIVPAGSGAAASSTPAVRASPSGAAAAALVLQARSRHQQRRPVVDVTSPAHSTTTSRARPASAAKKPPGTVTGRETTPTRRPVRVLPPVPRLFQTDVATPPPPPPPPSRVHEATTPVAVVIATRRTTPTASPLVHPPTPPTPVLMHDDILIPPSPPLDESSVLAGLIVGPSDEDEEDDGVEEDERTIFSESSTATTNTPQGVAAAVTDHTNVATVATTGGEQHDVDMVSIGDSNGSGREELSQHHPPVVPGQSTTLLQEALESAESEHIDTSANPSTLPSTVVLRSPDTAARSSPLQAPSPLVTQPLMYHTLSTAVRTPVAPLRTPPDIPSPSTSPSPSPATINTSARVREEQGHIIDDGASVASSSATSSLGIDETIPSSTSASVASTASPNLAPMAASSTTPSPLRPTPRISVAQPQARRHAIFSLSRGVHVEDPLVPTTPLGPTPASLSLSLPLTTPTVPASAPQMTAASKPMTDTAPLASESLAEPSSPMVALEPPQPQPPHSRRVLTSLYAQDELPFEAGSTLRFESVQLPSSTLLHVLRTAPPSVDQLLHTCAEFGIWPNSRPLQPFYSDHDHWHQHLTQLHANQSGVGGISVHAYAAEALGPAAAVAIPDGIQPPKDLIECLPKMLPTPKASLALAESPSFEAFHGSVDASALTASEATERPRPIFLPSVLPPSLHSFGPTGASTTNAFEYVVRPPTLSQLAHTSKNWSREIRDMTAATRTKERGDVTESSVRVGNQQDRAAAGPEASGSESDELGLVEPSSDLPRPASPKHDESCLLSYSYFQTASSQSSMRTLARSNKSTALLPPPSTSKRTSNMPRRQHESKRIALHSTAATPPNAQADPSPALQSPHPSVHASTSASPHSSVAASSIQHLATTAASRGTHTQRKQAASQIEGPTPTAATSIRYNIGSPSSSLGGGAPRSSSSEQQHLTIFSLEVHACSRGQLLPDPRHDAVAAIIYCVRNQVHGEHEHRPDLKGVLLCPHVQEETNALTTRVNQAPDSSSTAAPSADQSPPPRTCPTCSPNCTLPMLGFDASVLVQTFRSESMLLDAFVSLVHRLDPDIVMGWEVQKGSLGYLVERAHHLARPPMQEQLSRVLPPPKEQMDRGHASAAEAFRGAERDRSNPASAYAWSHSSGLTVSGRIVLNLWRIMRDEVKLCSYSFETVAAHILGRRFPSFPSYVKTRWFQSTLHAAGGCRQTTGEVRVTPPAAYSGSGMYRLLAHYLDRCASNLAIVDQLDLIGRTSELARVFGIKFYSVLDRGSQFRVESMLLRLSKPQNHLLLSISPLQRSNQPAMECIPLVMEPISSMYTDPVVVLDFQSLYPSMMIAYNICFSTCLGRVPNDDNGTRRRENAQTTPPPPPPPAALPMHLSQSSLPASQSQPSDASQSQRTPIVPTRATVPPRTGAHLADFASPPQVSGASLLSPATPGMVETPPSQHQFGGAVIHRPNSMIDSLHSSDSLWVSSNGVMFAKSTVRAGLLPRLLREILESRVMVKKAMNRPEVQSHRGLHRLLNARQFGLKLISNVTYGYTAAGFSGRMPCAEIADAIVQSGRDTLERAIHLVESDPVWRAKVVYGDTDSLFVLLPGRTRAEAFEVGREIASRVTQANPKPVKLQLDKVYQPCCLISKKRYVGYKYESPTQQVPTLDAKGIETVRRDGCPAVGKMMSATLKLLFDTRDLSVVRTYLERQWSKVWRGRVSIGDFVFAKEVRLGSYRHPPLAAVLAQRLLQQDPRAAPLHAERVPYVIVDGAPQARLVDRLQHPLAVLLRPDLYRLCATYYLEVVLNRPLARLLALVGVDINTWFAAWPRPRRQALAPPLERASPKPAGPSARDASLLPPRATNSTVRVRGLPAPGPARPLRDDTSLARFAARRTIDQYYASQHCAWCDERATGGFCTACRTRVDDALRGDTAIAALGALMRVEFFARLRRAEESLTHSMSACDHCVAPSEHCVASVGGATLVSGSAQHASPVGTSLANSATHVAAPCTSLDCPNQYERQRRWLALRRMQTLVRELEA